MRRQQITTDSDVDFYGMIFAIITALVLACILTSCTSRPTLDLPSDAGALHCDGCYATCNGLPNDRAAFWCSRKCQIICAEESEP